MRYEMKSKLIACLILQVIILFACETLNQVNRKNLSFYIIQILTGLNVILQSFIKAGQLFYTLFQNKVIRPAS